MQEPLERETKAHAEYGLRLILTFQPSTNFLVPLDRCTALARSALAHTSALSTQRCSQASLEPWQEYVHQHLSPQAAVASVACSVCDLQAGRAALLQLSRPQL